MSGLLFEDITAYVKDLISRELRDQTDFMDKQKAMNNSNRLFEPMERQDEPTSNTATSSIDQ